MDTQRPDTTDDAHAPSHRHHSASPQHLPFLTLVLLLLIAFYAVHGPIRSWLSGRYRAARTLDAAFYIILDEYVDTRAPDEVVHGALRGMVDALGDRHSAFLSPATNERLQETESGRYAGIGIAIRLYDGKVLVQQVFDHSPALRAGLRPGDFIVAADGTDLTKLEKLDHASNALRGKEGTTVALRVLRNGSTLDIAVTREVIRRPVVEHRTLAPGIGYIRIADFPDKVASLVSQAIADLKKEGPLHALVLDLRWNQGGFLDEAVRVADTFIAQGRIVSTRSRHKRDDRTFDAKPGGPAEDIPLVALVNESSASAAEVVAGALQDHGRARLVGARTYGKGAVNKRFPLPDGSGILLSTGKYYLPKGRLIEGEGLTPDQPVKPPEREVLKNLPPGAKPPDPQLDAALTWLKNSIGKE